MNYQMTAPEDDPTRPWDYIKFGLGALAPENVKPWYQDQVGLGLSGSSPEPTIDAGTDGNHGIGAKLLAGARGVASAAPGALENFGLVLDAFGSPALGKQSIYEQRRGAEAQLNFEREKQAQALAQQAQLRRDTIAQHMETLEEQKRQHAWDQNFSIATNDKLSAAQKMQIFKDRAKKGDTVSEQFAQGVNEKMLGEFQSLSPYMPQSLEDYENKLRTGEINLDAISNDMDIARETRKMITEAKKPALQLQTLQRLAQENPNDPAYAQALSSLQAEMQAKQDEAKIKSTTAQYAQPKAEAELANTKAETAMRQAPREMYSGISGPGGESVTGIYNPVTGKMQELRGTPIQRTQDMNAAQVKDTIDERAVLQQIGEVDKLYQDGFVGQLDNLWAMAKETAPGVFGPIGGQEEKFRKTVNQIVTNARRLDAGTAQSVQELAQLSKSYPDLSQHESVFKPALEAMRERITSRLQARNRLAAEIRAGKSQPVPLSERASQLAIMVSAPGFAKSPDDAKQIAQQILREEMKLGIVKAD